MYKISEDTLFLAKKLIYVAQCPSTNALASELGQKTETVDGTVVVTDNQTSGRGQRGNKWESQPGKNLTFSLILRPAFLSVKDQFQLNAAIAIGLCDYITAKVTEKVRIKWPNDLLIDGKKAGGVLIENHVNGEELVYSVIGIGLNLNQQTFASPNAVSLKSFTGMEYDAGTEFGLLLLHVESRYLELKHGNQALLRKRYLKLLYRRDESHQFRAQNEVFQGIITGVNEEGQLSVLVGNENRVFGVKEITFL